MNDECWTDADDRKRWRYECRLDREEQIAKLDALYQERVAREIEIREAAERVISAAIELLRSV